MAKSVPNGYWKEWPNVEGVLRSVMSQNGGIIPPRRELYEMGLGGMCTAISLYHGGLDRCRHRLGVDNLKVCSKCDQVLSKDRFRVRTKRIEGGFERFLSSICKSCDAAEVEGYRKTWPGKVRQLLRQARHRARKAGLPFTITPEWVLRRLEEIDYRCELTGIPFDLYAPGAGNGNHYTVSLDRIDSGLGYTPDNVQLILNWANRAKSNLPLDEFIRLCRAVAKEEL